MKLFRGSYTTTRARLCLVRQLFAARMALWHTSPTPRLRHSGQVVSDCQPKCDPGVACGRFVGRCYGHNHVLRMYSKFRCCSLTMRGRSVNQKPMATPAKTISIKMSKTQNHSKPENDAGQPCQNGNEAPAATISQTHASNVKNRVLGRRTISRTVQLPVSKLSGYDSIRATPHPSDSQLTDNLVGGLSSCLCDQKLRRPHAYVESRLRQWPVYFCRLSRQKDDTGSLEGLIGSHTVR
jgi:hypothetical protein